MSGFEPPLIRFWRPDDYQLPTPASKKKMTLPDIALGYIPTLRRLEEIYWFGPILVAMSLHPLSVDYSFLLVQKTGLEPATPTSQM